MKTPKKRSRTINTALRHRRLITAITVVSLISLVGAYYVVRSHADPIAPNIVYYDTTDGDRTRAAGEAFSLPIYSDIPSNQAVGSEDKYRMYMLTLTVSENVKINSYICGDAGTCTTYAVSGANLNTQVRTCINMKAEYFGRSHIRLLTLNMTSLQGGQYDLEWSLTVEPHTCNGVQGGTYYHYAYGDRFGLGQGLGPNDGDGGDGGTGAGSDSKGSSGGSSSTKNQASTQSPAPNPVPISSSQGDQSNQPKVEPSPFYDGKQYEAGSDGDTQETSILASAGHQAVKSWPLVTVLLGLVVVGGGLYWRFWHKRKS